MGETGSDAPGLGSGEPRPGGPQAPRGENATEVRAVFDAVADRYDFMNDLMSGGVHRLWKRALVDALNPAPPFALVDVAGGTGDIALRVWDRLASRTDDPADAGCRLVVCDVTEAMVERGRDRALNRGVAQGLDFVVGNAEALPLPATSQDAVTVAFGIRNVTDRGAALREARRVLRRGGRFLCLEFGGPVLPGLHPLYDAYRTTALPWIGQAVTGRGDAYRYLADSIARFPDRDAFAAEIEAAGFDRVRPRPLSGGIATLYSAWRF